MHPELSARDRAQSIPAVHRLRIDLARVLDDAGGAGVPLESLDHSAPLHPCTPAFPFVIQEVVVRKWWIRSDEVPSVPLTSSASQLPE